MRRTIDRAMSFCGADLCFSGGASGDFRKEVVVWPQDDLLLAIVATEISLSGQDSW